MQKRPHISKLKLSNDEINPKFDEIIQKSQGISLDSMKGGEQCNRVWELERKAVERNVWKMKN